MLEHILTALKPLTAWQIVALAALVHALLSGVWLGFLLFALTKDTPTPPADATTNERSNP